MDSSEYMMDNSEYIMAFFLKNDGIPKRCHPEAPKQPSRSTPSRPGLTSKIEQLNSSPKAEYKTGCPVESGRD
jgi:hypothetical protein